MDHNPSYKKTTAEVIKDIEMQMEMSYQGKQNFRNQSQVLCKALHQLKKRKELGHDLAGDIWRCMIEGITEKLPPEFFTNHAEHFFWRSDEVLTEDEITLKVLLEKSLERYKEKLKSEGGKSKKKTAQAPVAGPSSGKKPESGKKGGKKKGTQNTKEEEDDDDDKLLEYLISVIKVAIDTTDVDKWDWKPEDNDLKAETYIFHQGLKVAMQLFEEIHRNPRLESLISEIEKISMESEAVPKVGSGKSKVPAGMGKCCQSPSVSSTTSSTSCSDSSDAGTYAPETGEEELCDCYDEEDDEEDDEYDDEVDIEIIDEELPPGVLASLQKKKEAGLLGGACAGGFLCSTHPPASTAAKGQPYVVRQMRSEDGRRKRRPIAFKITPCDHIGCASPPAHGREWKKDGFWCNCGKKFATAKEFDRHLTFSMESLMQQCNKCDYSVNRRCCMEKHKRDTHEKLELVKASQRLYKCRFKCGHVFESKKKLHDHLIQTGRQCLHMNAGKLPKKVMPAKPETFMEMVRATLGRSGIDVTVERVEQILDAVGKDARLSTLRHEAMIKMKELHEVKDMLLAEGQETPPYSSEEEGA